MMGRASLPNPAEHSGAFDRIDESWGRIEILTANDWAN
jgi:hypothetical protein